METRGQVRRAGGKPSCEGSGPAGQVTQVGQSAEEGREVSSREKRKQVLGLHLLETESWRQFNDNVFVSWSSQVT